MKRNVKKILSLVMVLTLTVMMMPAMTFKLSAAPTVTGQDGAYSVTFKYTDPDATSVYVAGDVNSWSSSSDEWKLEKNGSGEWELTKQIDSGVYGYKFVVDGAWKNDPSNNTYFPGNDNSKLVVPGAVHSPVINGDSVIFNYPVAQLPADVTAVKFKSSANGWGETEMQLSEDGTHYTLSLPIDELAADTYEYGINVYSESGPSYGEFCKDYYNMEAVSLGGNSIFTIQPTVEYPDEDPTVTSPVISGHSVTFKLYAPGALSVQVAGSMTTPAWGDGKQEMAYDSMTGYWSVTLNDVASGLYEYKFVKNGNWIADPLNDNINEGGNSTFFIASDIQSPEITDDGVIFRFKPETDIYDSVAVAGTATTWDAASAPVMTKDNDGVYTYTCTGLKPGTYEYKFIGNPLSDTPAWMTDPANQNVKNGNSVFTIAGLSAPAGKLSVKKGENLELPETLTYYKPDGTTEDKAVTYETANAAGVSIDGTIVSVAADYEGETIVLTAKTTDGFSVPVTVSVVDKMYEVTVYYYYARNTSPTIEDSDIYLFNTLDSEVSNILEFSETYTDDDGNVWLKGSITIPYNKIGAIARLTKGSWEGGQDADREYTLTKDATTLWYVFGQDLTETQPTIIKDEDLFDGIKLHFLSPWGGANVYYWGLTPAGAVEPSAWPGDEMTDEGEGWFGFELPGVDAASLIFNYSGNQTGDLSRTTGEWWYAQDTWFDHEPTAEELETTENPTEDETSSEEDTSGEDDTTSEEDTTGEDDTTSEEDTTGKEDTTGEESTTSEEDTTPEDGSVPNVVILEGKDVKYTGNGAYVLRLDRDINKFIEVLMDDVVVDPSNYTVTEGSTILTFSEAYLKSLSEGEHVVKVNFTDGFAETVLTVALSADSAPAEVPTTGANNGASVNTGDVLPAALLILLFVSAAVVIVSKKKVNN
ncbi:MAG: starch-binding protein [Lachnospiraceae bacterium]|nr:starch-binding protein [Lachnospiraceae bacterium]